MLLLQSEASSDAVSEEGRKASEMSKALELSITGLDDGEAQAEPEKKKKVVKRKPVSKDPRDFSGYNFRDEDGEYDVPFVEEPMWFRLQVRKASERKFCEMIMLASQDPSSRWYGVVSNAFYAKDEYPRFKGNVLTYSVKPLIPGLVYIKTKMNYDIADDLEGMNNVYGFSKTRSGIVLPLPPTESESLEDIAFRKEKNMEAKYQLLKKDEYVSIISGPHEGKYGILQGTKRGKLEVILRGEYKDEWDLFELKDVEYLANPPEKKWNELSAKEAIESLMAKDPYNPTIKALRKEGILEDIINPHRRFQERDTSEKRIRSIGKDANRDNSRGGYAGGRSRDSWSPDRESSGGSSRGDSKEGEGDDDLNSFLEGLLQEDDLDSMLDGANKPKSQGGLVDGDGIEAWGTADGNQGQAALWSTTASASDGKMGQIEDLLKEGGELEDFLLNGDSSNANANANGNGSGSGYAARSPSPSSSSGPDMEQFENFGDYLTAIVDHAKSGGGETGYEAASSVPPPPSSSSSAGKESDDEDELDAFLDSLDLNAFDEINKSTRGGAGAGVGAGDVGGPDYSNYKVADLKALLKERGLKVGGTKSELISRLQGRP